MRKRGAFASPEALKSNPPLKELVLGYNQITDKGACELAEARCASAREEGRAPTHHTVPDGSILIPRPLAPSGTACVYVCVCRTPPPFIRTP